MMLHIDQLKGMVVHFEYVSVRDIVGVARNPENYKVMSCSRGKQECTNDLQRVMSTTSPWLYVLLWFTNQTVTVVKTFSFKWHVTGPVLSIILALESG